MRRSHIAVFVSIALSTALPALAQSAADGEKVFRKCASCHQVGDGAKNRIGPVLTDVFGSTAGSFEGYKYGKSMLAAGEDGLIWTEENLFNYLFSPKDFLRAFLDDPKAKAKMSFRLKDEQDRRDVVAYLSSFTVAMATPTNGFCVTNQSELTHVFAVDAGDAGRKVQELTPGQSLCTAESSTPQNGFVSVFETIEKDEGCSRLITAGNDEGMIRYSDFDRCEWTSNSS
ncbi:MAG: cytochrome c family protein [Rhodobacteraceae bacterium]|nr:cytochrome c family protein [Paracoccaceae bacterium]